jgi:hypothetical protein
MGLFVDCLVPFVLVRIERFYQGLARKASAFMPGMDSAEAAGFHCS